MAASGFQCKYIKLNQDKCHLVILGHKYKKVLENIGSCKIWENNDQKPLAVSNRSLEFNHYISKQYKKAG